jgi:uncharacterized protein (TIGR02246 family)
MTLLVATLAALPACAITHPGPEQRQAEFFAAIADRDADRTASFFADDAVLQVANMPPVEGREAIRGFYGNLFGFLSASSATPERLEVAASGDMAWSIGESRSTFRRPDGELSYTGKYALVWRKQDGAWRVALYAISSNERSP